MLHQASSMGKPLPRPLAAEGWRDVDEYDEHFTRINVIPKEASMACSCMHLVVLFAEGEWLARSVVKNSLTTDRGPRSYHIGDLCAIDAQPIAKLAGVELDPLLLALQPDVVEARYEEGLFPLAASRVEITQRLNGYGIMLLVGLGRSEMGSLMNWWQEELEGLNAKARELEAIIAANVAGILEV